LEPFIKIKRQKAVNNSANNLFWIKKSTTNILVDRIEILNNNKKKIIINS
jgi:hypothetical protein